MTKPILAGAIALTALFGTIAAGATAQTPSRDFACEAARHRPDLFKVAIDRDSGIAFVHSPCGYTYMGVVNRDTIDQDIAMSEAKPVPPAVLRAELQRQPFLVKYLPVRKSPMAPVRGAR